MCSVFDPKEKDRETNRVTLLSLLSMEDEVVSDQPRAGEKKEECDEEKKQDRPEGEVSDQPGSADANADPVEEKNKVVQAEALLRTKMTVWLSCGFSQEQGYVLFPPLDPLRGSPGGSRHSQHPPQDQNGKPSPMCNMQQPQGPKEEVSEHPGSADVNAEPVEDFNHKLTNVTFMKAYAGALSWVFACAFYSGQVATGYEIADVRIPIDMVAWIVGKNGETVRNICFLARVRIELKQPCDEFDEWIVRITGGEKEMETAKQMVLEYMDAVDHIVNNESLRLLLLHGPFVPQWGARGSSQTQPPQSYSHGYNEAKHDNHDDSSSPESPPLPAWLISLIDELP